MKHIAFGTHSDGSEVHAEVTDLAEFINCSPDSFVTIEGDDVYHQVKKSDINWKSVLPVEPLNI